MNSRAAPAAPPAALPLLSLDPPPKIPAETCQECSKKFNALFSPSKMCHHCGRLFCKDHVPHKAIRRRRDDSLLGPGVEVERVCGYCQPFVTMTSSDAKRLSSLSIKQLKLYITAYAIPLPRGLTEKSEFVEVILLARTWSGSLSPAHEKYFRQNSLPPPGDKTGYPSLPLFDFDGLAASTSKAFDRVANFFDLDVAPCPSTSSSSSTRPAQSQSHPSSSSQPRSLSPRASLAPASQPRPSPSVPRSTSAPPQPPPPSSSSSSSSHPTSRQPTLAELADLEATSPDAIADFPVKVLKSILSKHHVRSDMILEKSELVAKVVRLVNDEAARVRRLAAAETREREEERGRAEGTTMSQNAGDGEWEEVPEEIRREWKQAEEAVAERSPPSEGENAPSQFEEETFKMVSPPPQTAPAALSAPTKKEVAERTGTCVICYDRDAILASVDCGHLALCQECADLVMKSTRECPLCRSIMRPAGLLRIFSS